MPRSASRLGGEHDQRGARLVPVLQQLLRAAGLGGLEGRGIEDRDRAPLGVYGKRAAQGRSLLLAVDLEGVGARLWAERGAAARPQRRSVGARAGAAGALLAPRLGAAARNHAAGFGGRRSPPAGGLLGAHALMHERTGEAGAERGVVELHLLGVAEHGGVRHRFAPPPRHRGDRAPIRVRAAGSARRRPRPPRGPSG